MKQNGFVIKTDKEYATVEITRTSACEKCHSADACFSCNKKMQAKALNEIGAQVGDRVEIESSSSMILAFASLVFILPIVFALSFYYIGTLFTTGLLTPFLISFGGFALSFVLICFLVNKTAASKNNVKITKIISQLDSN